VDDQSRVSHEDLYSRLGKLEGLLVAAQQSILGFQESIRHVHVRMDAIEKRQTEQENFAATSKGARTALGDGAKDFLIPIIALIITFYVARSTGPAGSQNGGGTCPNPSKAANMLITPTFSELVIKRSL
jgi:hypothetical protein